MAVAHKGSISMGLVLIPVGLYKTTVDNDIHFTKQIPKVTLDKNELDMAKMLVDSGMGCRTFVDVPTAQTSRMMMLAKNRQAPATRNFLTCT